MDGSDLLWSLKENRKEIDKHQKSLGECYAADSRLYQQLKETLSTLPPGAVMQRYGLGVRLTSNGEVETFSVFDAMEVRLPEPTPVILSVDSAEDNHAAITEVSSCGATV